MIGCVVDLAIVDDVEDHIAVHGRNTSRVAEV
jgi:hypothetical protein